MTFRSKEIRGSNLIRRGDQLEMRFLVPRPWWKFWVTDDLVTLHMDASDVIPFYQKLVKATQTLMIQASDAITEVEEIELDVERAMVVSEQEHVSVGRLLHGKGYRKL